jgi:UDP-glucose 4-epimerase
VPIAEGYPTKPITSYGIVKLAAEKYLALFEHLHGLDYAALRISNPYGPYQDPGGQQGVIPVFLSRLRAGQPVTIWGDGSVVRDYLYVSDLVEALKLAAGADLGRKVLNVGSGRGTSLSELIAIIARVIGERPEVRYVVGRSLDVPASVLDVTRVREELGWKPRTGLDEGIDRTWNWIRTLAQEATGREAGGVIVGAVVTRRVRSGSWRRGGGLRGMDDLFGVRGGSRLAAAGHSLYIARRKDAE